MLVRRLGLAFVMLLVVNVAAAATITWDAYTDFSTASNAAGDTWQYGYAAGQGVSGMDGLFGGYSTPCLGADFDYGWRNVGEGTFADHYVGKRTAASELGVHPFTLPDGTVPYTTVVAWKSPITGIVDVSLSVSSLADGEGADGVGYALYQQGNETALKSGLLDPLASSGTLMQSGLAVSTGDMLYLHVAPRGSNAYDFSGITFSVSQVPEPGAMMLLICGVGGLLAYAWRRRA